MDIWYSIDLPYWDCVHLAFKKDKISKALFTIIPIIFWLPGFWLFVYLSAEHMSPETFLIPQNFRGRITLYYGESCGQELKKVDGRYIYHVPETGVMIIKNPIENGIIDEEFYFVGANGKRLSKIELMDLTEINEKDDSSKIKNDTLRKKIAVYLGSTGASAKVNGIDQNDYKFHEMFVESADGLRTYNDASADSVSLNILKNCRLKKNN